jgi:hypothetical protein
MENQYFIFKIKDAFLPEVIKEYQRRNILKQFSWSDIYSLDKKYFRKIKILNIENRISEEEKSLLEFLINESFTKILSTSEFEGMNSGYRTSASSSTSGWSGTAGAVGASGVSGYSGYGGSGSVGSLGTYNYTNTVSTSITTPNTQTVSLPFVTI